MRHKALYVYLYVCACVSIISVTLLKLVTALRFRYFIIYVDHIYMRICSFVEPITHHEWTISQIEPVQVMSNPPIMSTRIWLQILKLWHRYLHPFIPSDVRKSLAMHDAFVHLPCSQPLMMETLRPFTGLHVRFPMSWIMKCPFIWIPGTEICIQLFCFVARKKQVDKSESRTSATSVP